MAEAVQEVRRRAREGHDRPAVIRLDVMAAAGEPAQEVNKHSSTLFALRNPNPHTTFYKITISIHLFNT